MSDSEIALTLDEPAHPSKNQAAKDILAGTIGGIAQVLFGQPFDTTKVRLQSSSNPNATPMDVIRTLLKNEGPMAFYKGTLLPLVGIGACVSIQFSINEYMKRVFNYVNDGPGKMTNTQFFLSGAGAGFANGFLAGPIEHVRIRLQIQTGAAGERYYRGPVDVLKHLNEVGGLRAIYRGFGPTLFREAYGMGIYFMTFESLVQRTMRKHHIARNQVESWKLCLFGALSGYAMWFTSYPVDIVKSKLQTDTLGAWKYRGSADVIRDTYAKQGIKGFFVGFSPTILRAAPANAATFLAFEWTMRLLNRE